jgi:hypothetical protein
LDTETNLEEQRQWLTADLRQAASAPWRIVVLHRPPFASGHHGSDKTVREAFHQIFVDHGVDLVLAGHEHHYERTRPMDGVTYIVTGGGGRGTRAVGESWFTVYSQRVAHFLYVDVEPDRLRVYAIDATGQDFDGVMLSR